MNARTHSLVRLRQGAIVLVLLLPLSLHAAVVGIDSVTVTGALDVLTSVTVGTDTWPAAALRTGTSTGGDPNDIGDFSLETTSVQDVIDTRTFDGETLYRSRNGAKPDFFYFESGGNDNISIQAILSDGSLGQAITPAIGTWSDVGVVNEFGQNVHGIAFDITDLEDGAGVNLSADATVRGFRINNTGADPVSIFVALSFVHAADATGITATGATLNGALYSTNGPTYVWVAYGHTDGGTNKSAWANFVQYDGGAAQATGTLAYAVSGLAKAAGYYHRFYASNTTWDAWSDTEIFSTEFVASRFSRKMKVQFSGYNPPGAPDDTLTNFPALIVLSNNVDGSGFSYSNFAGTTGYELRFTAADGTTEIPYEVDGTWTHGGTNWLWVRVPELVDTNTYIWAYWGNPNGTGAPPGYADGAVWTNGYEAVWHFGEMLGTNSSANSGLDGVVGGVDMTGSGPVGAVATWADVGDYIRISDNAALDGHSEMTWSLWINVQSKGVGNDYGRIIDSPNYHLITENSSTTYVSDLNGLGQNRLTGTIADQQWIHFAHVDDSSSGRNFYTNGIVQGSPTGAHLAVGTTAGDTYIGSNANHGQALDRTFDGSMDEWRISSVARSPDWIWAEYMNMASNTVFSQYCPPEPVPVPGTVYRFR